MGGFARMTWTIRKKLIMAFLSIVLLFCLGGAFILYTVRDTGLQSTRFVTEYWPTAGLVREVRIVFDDIAEKVLTPPGDGDPEELIKLSKTAIQSTREKFYQAALPREDVKNIVLLLKQIESSLALPIKMYAVPGERMEEADAAVETVLGKVNGLGDTALVNSIWQAVMAFNDILITGDQAELENFKHFVNQIESHPLFPRFESEYRPFKAKALRVFEAARELSSAQQVFVGYGRELVLVLRDLDVGYERGVVKPAAERIVSDLINVKWIIYAVALVSTLFSLTVGFYMARGIGRPIKKVRKMISQMEQGRLNHRLHSSRSDELGDMARAMDGMANKLGTMVGAVGQSTEGIIRLTQGVSVTAEVVDGAAQSQGRSVTRVTESLGKIRNSREDVARGIDHLAKSGAESASSILELSANIDGVALHSETLFQTVDDVGSSIDEMAATIKQIADSARNLSGASDTTSSSIDEMDSSIKQVEEHARNTQAIVLGVGRDAERGKLSVEATAEGMEDIRKASRVASAVIATLAEKALDIGGILSVIGDITEQTNLLALNAAIIAAQAGDQGRAFGVVSDEIRELADRTNRSTKEITVIINGIQHEATKAVEAIQGAEGTIVEGRRLSGESSVALDKIVSGLRKVGIHMDRVVNATSEQAKGGRNISLAMDQVSQMIHQIAKATGEQEKGSRLIMSAATTMRDLTGQVSNATREQSLASKNVARSTENILEMIRHIKMACDGQMEETEQIVQAIDDIRASSEANIDATRELNAVVAGLSKEVEALEEEMVFFRMSP